jgi:hypothetical protein
MTDLSPQALRALADDLHQPVPVLAMMRAATTLRDIAARAETAERKLAAAREALEPFATYLTTMPVDRDDKGNMVPDSAGVGWAYLTVGEFRRARAALALIDQPTEKSDG